MKNDETMPDVLKWIENGCFDLRCVDVPTGGDDSEISWQVISHHMAEPNERIEGLGSSPLNALEDAGYTRADRPDPELAEVREALEGGLDEFDGAEINPSNYTHDDIHHLNNGYVGLFQTIEAAIAILDRKIGGAL